LAAFFCAVLLFGFLNSDFILLNALPQPAVMGDFVNVSVCVLNNLLCLSNLECGIAFAAPPERLWDECALAEG
jgi:hypothetical protein